MHIHVVSCDAREEGCHTIVGAEKSFADALVLADEYWAAQHEGEYGELLWADDEYNEVDARGHRAIRSEADDDLFPMMLITEIEVK